MHHTDHVKLNVCKCMLYSNHIHAYWSYGEHILYQCNDPPCLMVLRCSHIREMLWQKGLLSAVNSEVMHEPQLTKVTFKPRTFLLVNIAISHDQIKLVVKSVWASFTQNSRFHRFLLKTGFYSWKFTEQLQIGTFTKVFGQW